MAILPSRLRPPPPAGGSSWVAQRQRALIGLDQPGQRRALRIDHRPAQLAGQHPRRPVRAEPEQGLQLAGRQGVAVSGDQERGEEPDRQRQLAVVQDRAGGHRGLAAVVGTLKGVRLGRQRPGPQRAAGRADKAVRPAEFDEIGGAGGFGAERGLELDQRRRIPAHGRLLHPVQTMNELTPWSALRHLHLVSPDTGA
jgi:hypothetical protein